MHESERRKQEQKKVFPSVFPAFQRQKVREQIPVLQRKQAPESSALPSRQTLTPDLARSPFTAQRRAVQPTLKAAGYQQEDRQAVQASSDQLAVQRAAVQESGETLSQRGLTPEPQHLLNRKVTSVSAAHPHLTPTDLQERTKALGQESLAVLKRDAGYLPFHKRAELACHALEAGRQQGIEVEPLRQELLAGVEDPMQQETLKGLFFRQDQGRLQATQAQADHLLLLNHAQLQRVATAAQQEHDDLTQHTALERIQARRGGGQPLPEDVRQQLELGLNHDLSGVRLHVDQEADQIARSLNAVAFTAGRDIYFQQGEYNPASKLDLLAHEVAHVKQQDQGQVPQGLDPDAGLESQAQKFGEEFALGQASGLTPKGAETGKKAQTVNSSASAAPQLAVQRLVDPVPAAKFWLSTQWTHQFTGTLGKSHITMTLTRSGDQVTGSYQYQGHAGSLSLTGKFDVAWNTANLTELDLKSPDGTQGTARLILTAESDTVVHGSWISAGKDLPISVTVTEPTRQPAPKSPTPILGTPKSLPPQPLPNPDPANPGQVNPAFQTALIDGAMAAGIKHGLLAKGNRATVSATIPKILEECMRDHVTDPASIAVIISNAMRESKLDPGAHEGMFYTTMKALKKAFSTGRFGGKDPSSFLRNPESLANQVYAHILGNGDVASEDGYRFRGRGLPQTTGRANYAKLNNLNPQPIHDGEPVDFTKTPDLAADEALSLQILVQGISQGVFTGTTPLKDFLGLRSLNLATFTAARRKYVGNLDAPLVGAVTVEIYQAIKGLSFLNPVVPGKQP